MKKNEIAKKIFYQIFGLALLALGITGVIVTNLGSSAIDAFNVFFGEIAGISIGTATFITNTILALVLFVIVKKKRILLSIIVALLTGVLIDLWREFFVWAFNLESANSIMNSYYFSIPFAVISTVIIAIGACILIINKSIMSPYDEVTNFLGVKFGAYRNGKMAIDGFFLVSAIILGIIAKTLFTQVNFYSFVIVAGLGPLINYFLNIYERKRGALNETE